LPGFFKHEALPEYNLKYMHNIYVLFISDGFVYLQNCLLYNFFPLGGTGLKKSGKK